MVAFHILIYPPMGWITTASIYSITGGYSQSPPAPHFSVSPMIRCAARCWNPSRTLSISPATTQIYLRYKITDCATALYVAPRDRTVSPVHSITLDNNPQRL